MDELNRIFLRKVLSVNDTDYFFKFLYRCVVAFLVNVAETRHVNFNIAATVQKFLNSILDAIFSRNAADNQILADDFLEWSPVRADRLEA